MFVFNFPFFCIGISVTVHRIMHISTLDIRSTCRIIPGLSREQIDLCYKANDVTSAALDGLDLAMRECQLQVKSKIVYHTHCKRLKNNFEMNENRSQIYTN